MGIYSLLTEDVCGRDLFPIPSNLHKRLSRTWSKLDWMAQMQFYTRIAWNLEMTNMMLGFLRETSIHPQISFLHNILWVFIVSWQKDVCGRDLFSIPFNLHKDEVKLTIWGRDLFPIPSNLHKRRSQIDHLRSEFIPDPF